MGVVTCDPASCSRRHLLWCATSHHLVTLSFSCVCCRMKQSVLCKRSHIVVARTNTLLNSPTHHTAHSSTPSASQAADRSSTHAAPIHTSLIAVPVGSRSHMTFPHTHGDAHITDVTVSGCPDNSHSGSNHTDPPWLTHGGAHHMHKAGRDTPTTSLSAHQPWLVCVLLFYYATHPHAAQSNTPKAHTRTCQQTHTQQRVLACGLQQPNATQPTKFAARRVAQAVNDAHNKQHTQEDRQGGRDSEAC
jgi:hypothetical protein